MRHITLGLVLLFSHLPHASAAAQDGAKPPASAPAAPSPEVIRQQRMDRVAEVLADGLQRKHGLEQWKQKKVLHTDITITVSDQPSIEGTLIHEVATGRSRFVVKNGPTLLFDGTSVWATGSTDSLKHAWHHGTVWSQVLAAPFHLRQDGFEPSAYRQARYQGRPYDSFRLTRRNDAGGETWWAVYADQPTRQLAALCHVAVPMPDDVRHMCLSLEELVEVEGVTLPTRWVLYNSENDTQVESVGQVRLANLKFTDLTDDMFAKPAEARQLPAPSAESKPAAKSE